MPGIKLMSRTGAEPFFSGDKDVALVLASGWTKPHWAWQRLRLQAQARGFSILQPDYPNFGIGSISETAAEVLSAVELAKKNHDRVIFIGHSMGGLIGRYLLTYEPQLFDAYISIGTPHSGSPLAKLAFFSAAAKEMRPDSPFLAQLNSCEWPQDLPTLTIKPEYDWVVPKCSFQGDQVVIPKATHTAVLFDPACHEIIFTWIDLTIG